jgi:hypothetical protein
MRRGTWEKEREGRIREKECEKSRERPKEEEGGGRRGREAERERGRWKREMDGGGEWSGERKVSQQGTAGCCCYGRRALGRIAAGNTDADYNRAE